MTLLLFQKKYFRKINFTENYGLNLYECLNDECEMDECHEHYIEFIEA